MKKILTQQEEQNISSLIQNFEEKTNAEFIIAINQASDPYPAARLRVAIMTSILCACLFSGHTSLTPIFIFLLFILFYAVSNNPFIKKWSLSNNEVTREVKEKAIEIFYTQVLNNLEDMHSPAILLYISLMERKIEIVVSKQILKHLTQEDLNQSVSDLSQHFKLNDFNQGLIESVHSLEKKLLSAFPNKIHFQYQSLIENKIIWLDSSK